MYRRFGLGSIVGALVLLLFNCSSCSKQNGGEPPVSFEKSLIVRSNIEGLRAKETSWEAGDKIGIYVVNSGSAIGASNIYNGADNREYVTKNADGRFSPVGDGISLVPGQRVDVYSYYPYHNVGQNYTLDLNISDQSDLSKIDLLYSGNVKGLSSQRPIADLTFTHQLSQLQVTAKANEGADINGLEIIVGEVLTNATYSLAEGKITHLADSKASIKMYHDSDDKNSVVRRAILLPGQKLEGLVYTFKFGDKSLTYTEKSTTILAPGTRASKLFLLDENTVKLIGATIEIIDEGEGSAKQIVEQTAISVPAQPKAPSIVEVKAMSNETWTATTDAPFIHLKNAKGSGQGFLTFTVDENTASAPRTATIVVTGKRNTTSALRSESIRTATITITQEGNGGSTGTNKAYYMEQVIIKSGYMQDVIIQQHDAPDSWFKGGTTPGGKRRNYTIYYSKDNIQPYIIAFPLYRDCIGDTKRTDAWNYDPEIAIQYQPNLKSSYKTGYSRGHMLSSGSRTASRNLNETTFYYTNMVPQNQSQNGGPWKSLEELERTWALNGVDTLYVVCGPILSGTTETVRDRDGKTIPVPTHTWKAFLKKTKNGYKSIATRMPNTSACGQWKKYTLSVRQLENELGVVLFPQLPTEVAASVKSQNNTSEW